jgi:gliding motility-associated-like protein
VELSGTIFQATKNTFEWQTTTGGILSKKDSLQIRVNKGGIYILKVKNTENECENIKSVTVLEDKILPTADAGAALEINCQDSILTLQGDKSSKGNEFVYNWTTTSNGSILSDEKTLNPKIDKAAPYYLLITNKNNGCQNRDTVVVNINKIIPLITIVKPDTLTCKKPVVDLKANATVTGSSGNYAWSTVNGNILNGKTSPTTSVNQPGSYILQVLDTKNFCKSNKQVAVTIDTIKPKVNAGANIELNCKSPTIDVTGTATAKQTLTLLWTTSNGTIVKDADKLKVTVKSAGLYKLLATNNFNGCQASDEMEVTFLGAPKAVILPPQVLTCAKTSVVLDSKGSDVGSNFTYTWSDTNGNSLGTNAILNTTKPGIYNFKVFNTSNDCEKKVQMEVSQDIVLPTADAGTAGVIDCEKGYVLINGKNSSQGAKYTYQWSGGLIESGANSIEAKVTAQAIYKILVTNTENGCSASDTVAVLSLKPALLETVGNQPLCNGDKGSIFVKTVSGGTPPFSYSVDSGINFYNYNTFNGLKAGEYTIFVQDSKGCEDSSTVELFNPEKFSISIPSINEVKIGDDIQLQATVNPTNPPLKSIKWTPDSILTCKNCLNPTIIKPLKNIYFTLKVVNENGCVAETFTNVEVDKRIDIYPPSAFSPNGDNSNDRFMLFGNPELVLRIKWLKVYDRWGDNVYSETDIKINDVSRGWNGELKGTPMNPAVFVWDAEVEFIDGTTKILKGEVTLMR